jgi:hypothetical protein
MLLHTKLFLSPESVNLTEKLDIKCIYDVVYTSEIQEKCDRVCVRSV